jgi:hypothetical protein
VCKAVLCALSLWRNTSPRKLFISSLMLFALSSADETRRAVGRRSAVTGILRFSHAWFSSKCPEVDTEAPTRERSSQSGAGQHLTPRLRRRGQNPHHPLTGSLSRKAPLSPVRCEPRLGSPPIMGDERRSAQLQLSAVHMQMQHCQVSE